MLQNIRSNIQGTLAKVIIGLIVVSFALFGIESILLGGGQSGVAEVNGEAITGYEVQQTVNLQRRQLLSTRTSVALVSCNILHRIECSSPSDTQDGIASTSSQFGSAVTLLLMHVRLILLAC